MEPMDILPYSVWENGEVVIPGSVGPPMDHLMDLLYPFDLEKLYVGSVGTALARQLWWLSYAASAAYLVMLWAGQAWMKGRGAFDLKGPLAAWNLLLAVFSVCGALRMVPQLILLLWLHGVQYSVCRTAYYTVGNGACGLWMVLFVWSKYVELIDTLFLVLRKKKVGFLHWYHHFSVLLYTWHAFVWESPTGIWFAAMNYTVHAIMYSYYFLAAVCSRPPQWALLVTCMQISQMFVGSAVAAVHLRSLTTHQVPNCDGHLPNIFAAIAMYASYFLLFLDFMIKRFCMKRRSPSPQAKKTD